MDAKTRANIRLDLKKIITARAQPPHGFDDVYEECANMIVVLEKVLGPAPGSARHTQIRVSLTEAVTEIAPPYRQQAAAILLGLAGNGGTYSARIDEIVQLYSSFEPQPARRNRQVILRAEVPEIEAMILSALLAFIERFIDTKSLIVKKPSRQISQQCRRIGWDEYDQLIISLADAVDQWLFRLHRSDPKPREVAVLGVCRGGLIPSVHLANLLANVYHGTVGLWRFNDAMGKRRCVVDALYGPPRRFHGSPRALIVVNDVLPGVEEIVAVHDELGSHYGEVDLCFASLCRRSDITAPIDVASFQVLLFNSEETWIEFPWERSR